MRLFVVGSKLVFAPKRELRKTAKSWLSSFCLLDTVAVVVAEMLSYFLLLMSVTSSASASTLSSFGWQFAGVACCWIGKLLVLSIAHLFVLLLSLGETSALLVLWVFEIVAGGFVFCFWTSSVVVFVAR